MNDTSPEVKVMVREMMMARSGEERFVMGALMFDAARDGHRLPAKEYSATGIKAQVVRENVWIPVRNYKQYPS